MKMLPQKIICITFLHSLLFGQKLSLNTVNYDTLISKNLSHSDSISNNVINSNLLGKYLKRSGIYLKKSAETYSIMPNRTLNMIAEENNVYTLMGLTFIILPIELTLSRFWGELSSAYYFGKSGNELINVSEYIQGSNSASFKIAGQNFKKCGNYNYLSSGFMVGGLTISTYALLKSFENNGNGNSNLFSLGISSILISRLLHLIPLHYATLSGKNLTNISGLFQDEKQNRLIYQSGLDVQNYSKRTYWGYYLQALGATLFLVSGENNSMKSIGLGTFILSWFIFDEIGLNVLKSAGDKLEDLGTLLL